MPEPDDNGLLISLIRQLIGLEPLLDVAELVDKLVHGGQRFLKYARDNNAPGKAQQISKLLTEAQEKIAELETALDVTIEIAANDQFPEEWLIKLAEAREDLDRRQAESFQALSTLAFEGFDPAVSEHRKRVVDAVVQLSMDAGRQGDMKHLPPVLQGITSISQKAGEENFNALKSMLQTASQDLRTAKAWAERQKKDALLRLKAMAAEHFLECDDPLCPLCQQSLDQPEHQKLVDDLLTLRSEAAAAQTQLDDACRRIEAEVRDTAVSIVPEVFMRVGRFAVKQNIQDQIRLVFVEAPHVAETLTGFGDVAQAAIETAFNAVDEVELGTKQPEPAADDLAARVKWLLDHLEDILNAAENWNQSRQAYRDAWTLLFSSTVSQSLTSQIRQLKGTIEAVEPFRSASEKIKQALDTAEDYNAVVKRQHLREEIAEKLRPLRKLRDLVNLTTRGTIDDVSDTAKAIHQLIYNPEALIYERADISDYRGKQSLTFQGSLGKNRDWLIDASLLANTSWMRGILWSFVFAIRERTIVRAGSCPFELVVLDDPQMTFDSRNMKGWVRFLGHADGLRSRQRCQVLVTTHSMPFALDMTPMTGVHMAAIETGQPWSRPSQLVEGDFAAVRHQRMLTENSDERARSLIGDIRVLAETLIKHSIQPFDPAFVDQPEATLGRLFEWIAQRNATGQAPYTDGVFGDLIAVKSSSPDLFSQLSEPHHSVSEAITVREARLVYQFWKETLFPAIRKVWEDYRFLQKSIIGEAASIPLPANCNHRPTRSTVLAAARPKILGRVSAFSDGRAASAVRIDNVSDGDVVDLSARAAYRLEKDTLSPVARVGDILLTRLDGNCRTLNLVIEDRGTYRVARRWLEDSSAPNLAVLAASSSNARQIPPAIISRAKGANRRKIVGVLFAADHLQPGETVDPNTEATDLDAEHELTGNLVADTEVFEILGSSAEPLALDKQLVLAKPPKTDLSTGLAELNGKPVIAENDEGHAFFKRLRILDSNSVVLESLDRAGTEGLILLSTDPVARPGSCLTRIREVVGVIFDRS
ncbi:MAG: hypothetical protein RIE83_01155 [Thalassobaculaceae bacterium]